MKKIITLKRNFEFKKVLEKGKYYRGFFIDIYITKTKANYNKIGIVVGKKVAKSVKRNRIKRLIRENYRLKINDISGGNNLIIMWKSKVKFEYATFINIKKDLEKILEKAEIYNI